MTNLDACTPQLLFSGLLLLFFFPLVLFFLLLDLLRCLLLLFLLGFFISQGVQASKLVIDTIKDPSFAHFARDDRPTTS